MITNKQLLWLQLHYGERDRPEWKTYMRRIEAQIEKNVENALMLARLYPEVFLNQVAGFSSVDSPKHKRWQDIMLIAALLKKNCDIYAEVKQNE